MEGKIEIDLESWDRREHFRFFSRIDLPFYNITCRVDIRNLPARVKKAGLSLNNTMAWLTTRTMNRIPEFRYRLEDGKVFLYDSLDPSITCIRKGEELFRFITVGYLENLAEFDAAVKKTVDESREYFDMSMLAGRSNFIYMSSLPWISFTGLDHTISLNRDDSVPRVTWGRFEKEGELIMIPFNIQVNHRFVDGSHAGRFFQLLDDEVRTLAAGLD